MLCFLATRGIAQADQLLKVVTSRTLLNWPLAIWQDELQVTPSAGFKLWQTSLLQLFLQSFCLVNPRCKLDLKERATTNKIKREEGEVAAELLP